MGIELMSFLNIAAYKFIELHELPTLRTAIKARCAELALRGTILLSPEGINIMLAGSENNIRAFQQTLQKDQRFADLHYKESYSREQTYNRLLVKIKPEIIAFGVPAVNPTKQQAPYIKPLELKQWLDEKRDVVLLDTRNDYEVRLGTFQEAMHFAIQHFRDFPQAVTTIDPALKDKTVVTFCTGGIRCEKAALLMQQQGFKNVYQLEGGILDYFAACGGAHYNGECFIFDRRVGINANLAETGTLQCFACLQPISLEEQQLPTYVPDQHCSRCTQQS
jgi:UPF0176 protein